MVKRPCCRNGGEPWYVSRASLTTFPHNLSSQVERWQAGSKCHVPLRVPFVAGRAVISGSTDDEMQFRKVKGCTGSYGRGEYIVLSRSNVSFLVVN